jgi:carboxyl-terminal processing protease
MQHIFIVGGEVLQRKRLVLVVVIAMFMVIAGIAIYKKKEEEVKQEQLSVTVLEEAKTMIQDNSIYDVTNEQLIEGALKGMTEAIKDPYSTYYSANEAVLQKQSLAAERVGIGIEVMEMDGKIVVVSALKNSPAEAAGIQSYDEIVQVDQVALQGKTMQEVLLLLQGQEGESVHLVMFRPSLDRHLTYTINRKKLTNETITHRILKDNDQTFGYVEISLFGESTAMQWIEAMKKIKKANVQGLVIDLRDNPGGYLHAAAQLLSTFEEEPRTFAYLENSKGEMEPINTAKLEGAEDIQKFLRSIPISVLINNGSASASEVFATALNSWEYATLIGEKSFGKGTVQETWSLTNGGELKLTTHKWLTVNREWIHRKGVEPAIEESSHPLRKLTPKIIVKNYKEGDFSDDIAYVQTVLKGLGYTISREDGYFDQVTAKAIAQYRKTHSLIGGKEMEGGLYQALQKDLEETRLKLQQDPQIQMGISYLIHQIAPGT